MHKNFAFLLLLVMGVAYPPLTARADENGEIIASADFSTDLGAAGWTLQGLGGVPLERDGGRLLATESGKLKGAVWYFSSPLQFVRGNVVAAYAGFLTFTLGHFEYETGGLGVVRRNAKLGPTSQAYMDVVLVSSDPKQSLGISDLFVDDGSVSHVYSVRLDEEFVSPGGAKWQILSRPGVQAQQAHVMRCLQSLTGIQIRGGYYAGVESTFLAAVVLVAGETNKGGHMDAVPIDGGIGSAEQFVMVQGVMQPLRAVAPAGSGLTSSVSAPVGAFATSSPYSANVSTLAASTATSTCTTTDRYELVFDRPGCQVDRIQTCPANAFDPTTSVLFNLLSVEALQAGQMPIQGQNIGLAATPIKKPFNREYTFLSTPQICSAATLEIEVHGDVAGPSDYIEVYGEDNTLLGVTFGGNLSQIYEDERVSQWSEVIPYIGAVAIPQDKMTLYAADRQITFRFNCPRGHLTPDSFSGTHQPGELTTNACNAPPCDLSGKVIIRSLRLTYSSNICYTSQIATDTTQNVLLRDITTNTPYAIPVTFPTPMGDMGGPTTDGAITVVTDANVVVPSNYFDVTLGYSNGSSSGPVSRLYSTNGRYKDRLAMPVVEGTYGGASPVVPRFADSSPLPKNALTSAVINGSLQVSLVTPDAGLLMNTHFSPIKVVYPLRHCFQMRITTGTYFNTRLARPSNLYMSQSGFPTPNSDVSVTMHVGWQQHARYTNYPGGNNPDTPLLRADSGPMGPGLSWSNYPDKIAEHQLWPHGFGYLQLRGDADGMLLANVFLHDYSQYSPEGYISDTVIIPRATFQSAIAQNQGTFKFTIWVPPGKGVIMLRSIVFGYAASSPSDYVTDTSSVPISFAAQG